MKYTRNVIDQLDGLFRGAHKGNEHRLNAWKGELQQLRERCALPRFVPPKYFL